MCISFRNKWKFKVKESYEIPVPDRYLETRSGLTLVDSKGSANATIKKFPMISMSRTGNSFYYTNFNTQQSGDWTIFFLFERKTGDTEARGGFRAVDYNMIPTIYLRDSVAANFGNPLYAPPSLPTVDWSETQIAGLKYDKSENAIKSFWNEDLESVTQSVGSSVSQLFIKGDNNYNDFYYLGVYMYSDLITEAEMTAIRTTGVFPSDNMIFGLPLQNKKYSLWYENFDAIGRVGRYSFGWTAAGTTFDQPDDPYGVRTNSIAAAYSLINGFTTQGVHQIPYKPDGTKGSHSNDDDIEHLSSGVIHNMFDSYIDFNPNNHSMVWANEADKVYAVFDKSNRTIWKSTIETDDYIQNADGNYTLWHVDELNEDFINTHAQTDHNYHIFCGLRTSTYTVTGITKIAVYKTNQS